MSTEFNYVVNIDTTRIMGAMSAVRSQLGMALGGPGSFGGDLVGGFGDPGIAYNPNYGQVFASTSHAQEQAVARHGLAAAAAMRPPGVSAYEYAMGAHGNAIDRQIEARQSAQNAGRSAFYSGVAGLAAGEVAFMGAGAIGGVVGKGLATRLLGAGAGTAGKLLGGLGLGIAAFGIAEEAVGGRIREHYAKIQEIGGITSELGDIVGGGRGLTRRQEYESGIAARGAAKDIGMDVQGMANIAAVARQTGLLPSTTDPAKLREQLGDLAKAIDEGAGSLHTSIAKAAMVIRSAAKQGVSAEEGILRAGAAGGPEAYLAAQSRYQAFGAAGGQIAMQQRLSQRQGFELFTGALGQAAGAGMSRDAMQVLGGRYGTAQLIGAAQMGAAMSPMGNLQLMASVGGEALGGMMDLPGQAIAAMSGGEGLMTNLMKFQVHQDEMRRGIGAKGIRTMARQQLVAGAEAMADMGLGGTERERQAFFAQKTMGLDPTQAMAYVSGVHRRPGRGGGGGGGAAYARRLETFQDMQLHRAGLRPPGDPAVAEDFNDGYGFGFGMALQGGMAGAVLGANPAAIGAGAAGGFLIQNFGAAKELLGDLFGGDAPPLFDSPQEKADWINLRARDKYDAGMSQIKSQYGAIDINPNVAARIRGAPLRGAMIDLDALGPAASARYGGFIDLAGVSSVEYGRGTVRQGGRAYSIDQVRGAADMLDTPAKVTKKSEDLAYQAVIVNRTEDVDQARRTFRYEWGRVAKNNFGPSTAERENMSEAAIASAITTDRQTAIAKIRQSGSVLVGASGDPALKALYAESGPISAGMRGFLEPAIGGKLPAINARMRRDIGFTGGVTAQEFQANKDMAKYFAGAYGGDLSAPAGRDLTEATDWVPRSHAGAAPADQYLKPKAATTVHTEYFDVLFARRDFRVALAAGEEEKVGRIMRDVNREDRFQDSGIKSDEVHKRMKESKVAPVDTAGHPLGAFFRTADHMTFGWASRKAREGALGKAMKEITTPISSGAEIQEWAKTQTDLGSNAATGPGKKKRKRRGTTMSKSIGFGQQESAMTTINRSLRRTHRMLGALDKRISGPGNGSGGGNSSKGSTTGGKP